MRIGPRPANLNLFEGMEGRPEYVTRSCRRLMKTCASWKVEDINLVLLIDSAGINSYDAGFVPNLHQPYITIVFNPLGSPAVACL